MFNIELFKNVFKLLSGSVIGALITFSLLPVLSRIFTPEQFGVFYLYSSIINTLPILATGRYELAIMLPAKDRSAMDISIGAFFISILFCLFLFIGITIFDSSISGIVKNDLIIQWLPVIPLAVLFISFSQIVNYWLLRKKKFFSSSSNKIMQATSTSTLSYYFGHIKFSNGLILGDLLGRFATAMYGIFQAFRNGFAIKSSSLKSVQHELKHYKSFPTYNLLPAFLDSFSLNIPVMLVSSFYSFSVNSLFNFPRQVLGVPFSLISASISQVFFQKIVEKKNNNESIKRELMKLLKPLVIMASVFIVVTVLFSEQIFVFVFGEPWREAGYYAKFLSFSIAIKFVVSPLSIVFPSLDAIKTGSLWQVLYFFSICILFFFGKVSIIQFIILYVVIELFMYLVYFYLIFQTVKKHDHGVFKQNS